MTQSEKRLATMRERYGESGLNTLFSKAGAKGGKAKVPTKGFGSKPYKRKKKS